MSFLKSLSNVLLNNRHRRLFNLLLNSYFIEFS